MSKDTQVEYDSGKLVTRTTSDDIELFSNAANAVSVNDAVYISAADTVSLANATAPSLCAIGLVFEVVNSTSCRVITSGLISGFSTGMEAGTPYYLSVSTPGALVRAAPGQPDVSQLVGVAFNATDLLVVPSIAQLNIPETVTYNLYNQSDGDEGLNNWWERSSEVFCGPVATNTEVDNVASGHWGIACVGEGDPVSLFNQTQKFYSSFRIFFKCQNGGGGSWLLPNGNASSDFEGSEFLYIQTSTDAATWTTVSKPMYVSTDNGASYSATGTNGAVQGTDVVGNRWYDFMLDVSPGDEPEDYPFYIKFYFDVGNATLDDCAITDVRFQINPLSVEGPTSIAAAGSAGYIQYAGSNGTFDATTRLTYSDQTDIFTAQNVSVDGTGITGLSNQGTLCGKYYSGLRVNYNGADNMGLELGDGLPLFEITQESNKYRMQVIGTGYASRPIQIGRDDATHNVILSAANATLDASGHLAIDGNLTVNGAYITGTPDGSLNLQADTDVIVRLDIDGDGFNKFQIVNQSGGANEVFSVNESGNLYTTGSISNTANGDIQLTATKALLSATDGYIWLKSDTHIYMDLDNDADGSGYLFVRSGADNYAMVVSEDGQVSLGNDGTFLIRTPGSSTGGILNIHSKDTTDADGPELVFTHYTPSIDDGTSLGEIWFGGSEVSNTASFSYSAYIICEGDGPWTGSNIPSRIRIGCSPATGAYRDVFVLDKNGAVYIPNGDLYAEDLFFNTGMTGTSSYLWTKFDTATGRLYYYTSTEKIKNNIQPHDKGLLVLNALRPVSFDMKNGETDCLGFIAEEVHAVDTTLSTLGPDFDYDDQGEPKRDSEGKKVLLSENQVPISWDIAPMLSMLVKSVQELSAKVGTLEAKVGELSGE